MVAQDVKVRKSKDQKPQSTTKKPMTLWKKVVCILFGAAVIGVIWAIILFCNDIGPSTVSAQMQLTFDGAAEGIAPDGRRFDIGELTSEEVIKEALAAIGFDGKYSAEQIRRSVVVAGAYPQDIVNQTMSYESLLDFTTNRTMTTERFNPTLFTVKLYNHFDPKIKQKDLEAILKSILTVYKTRFAEMYTQGIPSEESMFVVSAYDYPQQLEIIQQRLEIIKEYADEMYEKEPTFRFNGVGFNAISVRIDALMDSDIGRLNANLTLNALTKDPERLLTQYNFELRDLGNRLVKQREQLARLDKLVSSYEKSEILYISTKDSLTKIDGNSTETYDALVDVRRAVSEENTKISAQIATYELKLADLLGESKEGSIDDKKSDGNAKDGSESMPDDTLKTNDAEDHSDENGNSQPGQETETSDGNNSETPESNDSDSKERIMQVDEAAMKTQREALEKELATLEEKCKVVVADFSLMLKAWNEQKVNDTTVAVSNYRYNTQKLISAAFIKKVVMTAGPIFVLAMIICLSMIVLDKSRALKKV